MQLIKSPFQNIGKKSTQQGVVDISVLLKKLKEVDDVIESFQDIREKLLQDNDAQIKSLLNEVKRDYLKVKDSRVFIKGDPGKDAEPLNINDVVKQVLTLIPKPKDGVTPSIDTLEIAKAAAKFVKVPEPKIIEVKKEADLEELADAIIEMFQKGKKKLSTKHISDFTDGMEQYTRPLRSLSFGNRGGGDVVKAGSNITITTDADGKKVITSTGGSGFTQLSATETPDGSRTQFTFATATAQPSFIVMDNVWIKPTTATGGINWTWNNGTKVATMSVPAVDDIWGVV